MKQILVIGIFFIILTSCALSVDTIENPKAPKIKIGFIGPLTGDAAPFGQSIKRGVELAQIDANADIELVFEDSKCDPKEAVAAANKLITIDGVQAIVGEVCSGATLAAAPIAEENGVVLISSASTSPSLTHQGDYIFRTVPSDALQGIFAAKLLKEDGHEEVAVIYSNEEYGLGLNDAITSSFEALGGDVTASEPIERSTNDAKTQLLKIKETDPDAIFIISNNPDTAVSILKQIQELGIEAKIYGSEGLKSPSIIEGAGAAAEGLILSSVTSGSSSFITSHVLEYQEQPGPFAAQGYDALKSILIALELGAENGDEIKTELENISFDGASGAIDFNIYGDVPGNYDVLVVENGVFVLRE